MTTVVLDPLVEFNAWFSDAHKHLGRNAEIAALATVDSKCEPSIRMINYKGQRNGKFSFFSNYESNKGKALSESPMSALTFYWSFNRRQVRIRGLCQKLSTE